MVKNPNKTKWIISTCSIIYILFFLAGIFSNTNQETEVISKIHLNLTHNFIWCLTIELIIFLVAFWVNYWTWGIVGSLLCMVSTYTLGTIVKLSFDINSWLVFIAACLESLAILFVVLLSVYYKFENDFKKKQLCKGIMSIYILVTFILFIWALIESVYKFPMPDGRMYEILALWHSRPCFFYAKYSW